METILDRAADKGEEPTAEQCQQMGAWADKIKVLDAEIAELRTAIDANDKFDKTVAHVSEVDERRERRDANRRGEQKPERPMSDGEAFISSPAFKEYRGRGSMEPVEFEGFLERRAAIDTTVLDGIIPVYQWSGPTDPALRTPLLDVIGRERVSSGSIEYITWSTAPEVADRSQRAR